jgi:hypothetical protein
MADSKKSRGSLPVMLLTIIFFPLKIIVVYFINCAMDVSRACATEIKTLRSVNDDQRWGR